MRSFLVALSFLTRLPVPLGEVPAAELPRSVPFFPAVGLLLGLALAAAAWAVRTAGLSPAVSPVLLVGLLALLTGGLHLDGLADAADALGGGRGDRQRMLDIMKDPHVGAHGAAAVVLVLLAKVAGVAAADPRTLLAFPVVARWAVMFPVMLFPAARPEGLAASFRGAIGPLDLALATALAIAVPGAWGFRPLLPLALALGVALAFSWWMTRRLGGVTGDVHGAAIELAEVAFLAAAATGRA